MCVKTTHLAHFVTFCRMESTGSQQKKGTLSYEGYRYRHDRVNRDGSMSLRCVRRDCAGRIKKLVDGTTYCITQHSHVVSQQGKDEALLHERCHYQADNVNQNGLMSLEGVAVTKNTNASSCCRSVVPQRGKVAWLYEGYHYRCDRINHDGSLSLRCICHDCAGMIRKFIDGKTDFITPHSHESSSVVSQPGKENEALLLGRCHYQHDKINQDSLTSLQAVSVNNSIPASCSGSVIPPQGKETWMYEGYRYRRDRMNRNGSVSLRCVRRGCAGRIKNLVDGRTITVTMHSHAPPEVIKTEPECNETDTHDCDEIETDIRDSDENMFLQSMIGEFDLSLPSYYSSQQTVERQTKQDCIPDHETSSEIHTPGILEVIMLKTFLSYIIHFSTKCFYLLCGCVCALSSSGILAYI